MKIVYFVTEDYYFYSHRLAIARAAKQAGYEVVVLTRVNQHRALIEAEGFKLIAIQMNRSSTGIVDNLKLLTQVFALFKQIRPDILHNVALKPIVIGTLACLWASPKTKIVNAFAGMGYVFTSASFKAKKIKFILLRLYKWLFRSRQVSVLCQNQDDRLFFRNKRLVPEQRLAVIPGAGIDVDAYMPLPEPEEFCIAMVARLLKDKGLNEFIAAARILKQRYPQMKIILAGGPDPKNPSSVDLVEIEQWQRMGVIDYWGHQSDVRCVFAQAHVIVLPSYREGLPKVLLEASACQKAIITTDVPGCRELIQHEENGLLIPARSVDALVDAVEQLQQDSKLRQRLAARARQRVETAFSESIIGQETLNLYQMLLGSTASVQ